MGLSGPLLAPTKPGPICFVSPVAWRQAQVSVQVFFELIGTLGSTGVIVPAATGNTFQKGAVDTFTYPQLPYVGDPCRLRVFTDGAGFFPGWRLK